MKAMMVWVSLLLLSGTNVHAQVLKNGKLFYLRGSVGYATQSLDDLNESIRMDEQLFRSNGVPVDFKTFDGAPDFGGELGFRLSPWVSIGAGVNYQKNDLSNAYSDASGFYTDDITLKMWDVNANVSIWIPGSGFFFGGSGGVGFGSVDEDVAFIIYGDPADSYTVTAHGDGNSVTAGAFLGYSVNFAAGPIVFGKAGYAYRNLGKFDGTVDSPELGSYSGDVFQNNAGQSIEFDFSGVYVLVGFGVGLGRSI